MFTIFEREFIDRKELPQSRSVIVKMFPVYVNKFNSVGRAACYITQKMT